MGRNTNREVVVVPEKRLVEIEAGGGQAKLHWEGKRSLHRVTALLAQPVEAYLPARSKGQQWESKTWTGWPDAYPQGGLLFHGDNKDVLAHLLASEFRGRVNLIYIDPPFASGANYARKVRLRGVPGAVRIDGRGNSLGKQVQYSDVWTDDSYLQFMYERLLLLQGLLAEDGSIYLHCDWHKSHHLRCLMDEVFGAKNQRNEIVWFYPRGGDSEKQFNRKHDTILYYTKGSDWTFNYHDVLIPYTQEQIDRFDQEDERGCFYWNVNPRGERVKTYLRKNGIGEYDVWNIGINAAQIRDIGYPTMKPEPLLERIIRASSHPGDIVLDCFAGSGTTAVVAQELGRRWIAGDDNPVAIQTMTKRLQATISEQAGEGQFSTFPGFTVWRVSEGQGKQRVGQQQAIAQVSVGRLDGATRPEPIIRVTVEDYVNPTLVECLQHQQGKPLTGVTDWRAMVDCVMIDPAYDGRVFRVALADIPVKRNELVSGSYELRAPAGKTTVAVKIVDVLGEELLVVKRLQDKALID